MIFHITPFWSGVLLGPIIWAVTAFLIHRLILNLRWLRKVFKGHALRQWPALLAVSWGLPRLSKDYCYFRRVDGRQYFSPRAEKFRVLPIPEDLGE